MSKINAKRHRRALAAGALCLGLAAGAALLHGPAALAQEALQPQTANGIAYVSGGVGEGSLDAIRAVRGQYNLHLLFAIQGSGQYLADIGVKIENGKGQTVLSAVSDGPFFYAQLPAGHYRVSAESNGKSQTKPVEIGAGHPAGLSFYWPAAS